MSAGVISSENFQHLLRKVIAQGGKLADDATCEGHEAVITPAIKGTENQVVQTCACGLEARLVLTYDQSGSLEYYTACANCDRVDDQPRYL